MNKEEFDSALEASRDRLRGTGTVPSKVDNPQAVGCLLPVIIAALALAVLVTGCHCNCGWVTGPIYCSDYMQAAITWALLPDHAAADSWMLEIINETTTCYDENGEPYARAVCGVESLTTIMRPDGWVMVHADLILCAVPAPTPTATE